MNLDTIIKAFLFVFNVFKKTTKADKFYKYCKKQEKAESICKDLLLELDLSIVNISLFHNGEKYYNGTSHQKSSGFCEITANGVPSMLADLQNIPFFQFAPVFKKLIADGIFTISTRDKLEDTSLINFQSLMRGMNTLSCCYVPIVDKKERMIGYLSCSFYGKSMQFPNYYIQKIKLKASQISAILYS